MRGVPLRLSAAASAFHAAGAVAGGGRPRRGPGESCPPVPELPFACPPAGPWGRGRGRPAPRPARRIARGRRTLASRQAGLGRRSPRAAVVGGAARGPGGLMATQAIVTLMDAAEARECVDRIAGRVRTLRADLLDLD